MISPRTVAKGNGIAAGKKEVTPSQETEIKEADERDIKAQKMTESSQTVYSRAWED